MRDKLLSQYHHLVLELGAYYERQNPDRAILLYEKALDVHDIMEAVHRRLIACYLDSGRQDEALTTYRRCCHSLQALGLTPSTQTRRLIMR